MHIKMGRKSVMDSQSAKTKIRCGKCGKHIIVKRADGTWHFIYGKSTYDLAHKTGHSPVEMVIFGSLKMKCLDRKCRTNNPDHWNVLNYFPEINEFKYKESI